MTNEHHPGYRNVRITLVIEVVETGVPNYLSNEFLTKMPRFEELLNWKDKPFTIRVKEILSREEIK